MLSIGKLAPGPDAASYYLRRVGCPLDYYVGRGEAGGVWIGRGAEALQLRGPLAGPEAEQVMRGLLDGVGPDGTRLIAPVLRADPRSRLPAADVVTAVRRAADARQVDPRELLAPAGPGLARAWTRAARELELARRRPRWPAPSLPAETAERLLRAAGLNPSAALGQRTPTGRFRDRLARALAHRQDRVDVRLPGLDLTLSAPKSVSVLYALAGGGDSAEVRRPLDRSGPAAPGSGSGEVGVVPGLVLDAHRQAVAAAMDYLHSTCTTGLRGHHRGDDTDTRIATRGLIGAAFEHRSSRCGDPQLHTHVVVANLLHGVDGKWSAVDTREIYAQARTAGFVYQAVLRGELTRTLGVGWGEVRHGQADLTGVPHAVLRLFSKRRQQIEAQLELVALDGPRAAQAATLATRPDKPPAAGGIGDGQVSLRQRWQAEAAAAGFGPGQLSQVLAAVGSSQRSQATRAAAVCGPVADQLGDALLSPTGLTLNSSTFTRKDLLRGVCEHLPAGTPVTLTTLRALATRVLRDRRVVPLLGDAPVSTRRYTTGGLLQVENDAVELATAGQHAALPPVPDTVLAVAMTQAAAAGLSSEQTAMLRQLLSSTAGVDVVVGAAGSGKTAALAVAAHAWRHAGLQVRGTALAAIAARVLQDSAGIESLSLTRLLQHSTTPGAHPATPADQGTGGHGGGLPPGGVLVVDEAGMVGTRALHQLLVLSQQAGTKLVLVGDPHQLPEIDAGGLFATLATRLPATTLTGNQRQRRPWEQRALRELRDGDVLRALSAYRRHDRLRVTDTLTELTDRIVEDYQHAVSAHPGGQVLVIASSRGDARRLNARLREQLLADGSLGADDLKVQLVGRSTAAGYGEPDGRERGYRRGEQVLVTANDYPRGLLNGTRGTVTAVDLTGRQLTVRLEDGRHVQLDETYLSSGQLTHGYALTAHKAQGVTVDVALLWGTHALTRETGYVAMSRGRQANYLYATWDSLRRDTGDSDLDRPLATDRPDRAARRGLASAGLAERLAASGRQRLARTWWQPRPASPGLVTSGPDWDPHRRPVAVAAPEPRAAVSSR